MPIVSLAHAQELLADGEAVVFPTETVFGIGCDPRSQEGVARILQLKSRPSAQGMPLILSDAALLESLIAPEEPEVQTARLSVQQRFWPGALTLVITPRSGLAFCEGVAAEDGSLALRHSSSELACALADAAGGLLIASSANPRGLASACSTAEAVAHFPELPIVEGLCDPAATPSTILDVRRLPQRVLRPGAVDIHG